MKAMNFLIGLAALSGFSLLVGCGSNDEYQQFEEKDAAVAEQEHDHDHEHAAPHGGHLVELGHHEYNAEVVFDEEAHKIVVYLLDAHAENGYPIGESEIVLNATIDEKPAQYKLAAAPLETDPEGKSSRFEIADEDLINHFHHDENLDARLNIPIEGKSYVGQFSHDHNDHHHEHGDHDHAHEDDQGDHKHEHEEAKTAP